MSPDDCSTTSPETSAEDSPAVPEAPLLELRDGLPEVVDTEAALARAIERLAAGAGPVAVDAERASGHRYGQRAYLVQMRRAGSATTLIDPVDLADAPNGSLRPLADAISDTEWIIHAASQDLACLAELGMKPRQLFDTELAGRLLNYPRVGLGVLVEELLGYRMRKEHSAVDWSKRPLPESWLVYAALDVELLVELRDALAAQLEEAGKAEWARQEFAAWASMPAAEPRHEPWRRTSGIHQVRGRRGLAIVRAMWETREEIARQRDVSPSRVLRDPAIVQTATTAPLSRGALAQLSGFGARGARRHLRDFYNAVAAARALPDAELPQVAPRVDGPPPPRVWAVKDPVAAARLARCRAAVSLLARQHDLPQENLLSPDAVRRIAWTPPQPISPTAVDQALAGLGARPWQREITATVLADALAQPRAERPHDAPTGPAAAPEV